MFDVYSQCSAHARGVAFLHPKVLPTWPDMVRQGRDVDFDIHLYRASSGNLLSLLPVNLSAHVRRWQLTLSQRPAKRIRVRRDYLPIEHHSPADR